MCLDGLAYLRKRQTEWKPACVTYDKYPGACSCTAYVSAAALIPITRLSSFWLEFRCGLARFSTYHHTEASSPPNAQFSCLGDRSQKNKLNISPENKFLVRVGGEKSKSLLCWHDILYMRIAPVEVLKSNPSATLFF